MSNAGIINAESHSSGDVLDLNPDFGGIVTPVSGTINVFGQPSGSAQSTETINTSNDLYIVDRTFVTEYVVDPSSTPGIEGTFSTIQSAIDAIISDGRDINRTADLLIRPGTYVEDISISSINGKFNIYSLNPQGRGNNPTDGVFISGTLTATCNQLTLSNLEITTLVLNVSTSINSCYIATLNPNSSSLTLKDSIVFSCDGSPSISCYDSELDTINFSGDLTSTNSTVKTLTVSGNSVINFFNVICESISGTTTLPMTLIDVIFQGAVNAINPTCTIQYNNILNYSGVNVFGSNPTLQLLPQTQGNVYQTTRSATDYTVLKTDYYIGASGYSTPIQFTLPDTSSASLKPNVDQVFIFSDEQGTAATNNITIATNGGTINGGSSIVISRAYETISVIFDGTNYFASSSANLTLPLSVGNGGTGKNTLTNHGILVGAGTSAITELPTGTAGQVLQSGGASADPSYSTATYPSTAGTAGNVLTSDGTNWQTSILPTKIGVISGDSGSTIGSSITIYANNSGNLCGASVKFVNSGGLSTLNLTDSLFNVFLGSLCGKPTVTGANNSGQGRLSLSSISSGDSNSAFGSTSLTKLTTGSFNTALGVTALQNLVSGSNNIGIGRGCGSAYTTSESNNICIGTNLAGTAGESNVTRIGNGTTQCIIAGIRGVTTTNADAIAVLVDSSGQLGTVSSSIRYKENVEDLNESNVLDLRPVSFNYKSNGSKSTGLIAEEVEKIMPELVAHNSNGECESVKYHDLPVLLLVEIKKLLKRIEILEGK